MGCFMARVAHACELHHLGPYQGIVAGVIMSACAWTSARTHVQWMMFRADDLSP